MPTEDAYSSGHLVLSHLRTCMCSNVETNLSWTCLISGLLNFEHPSVLLFCSLHKGCAMNHIIRTCPLPNSSHISSDLSLRVFSRLSSLSEFVGSLGVKSVRSICKTLLLALSTDWVVGPDPISNNLSPNCTSVLKKLEYYNFLITSIGYITVKLRHNPYIMKSSEFS